MSDSKRPLLNKTISPENFLQFYWLKNELAEFCREYGLSSGGSKQELTERIVHFLKTGKKLPSKTGPKARSNKQSTNSPLTLESPIRENYKTDELHRRFFTSVIGERFKFNVRFMKWMKENAGKTYREAVDKWLEIEKEVKAGKKNDIAPQFEYNRYTRAFFKANPGKTRQDAIRCWNYKKSLPGTNEYEEADLKALD